MDETSAKVRDTRFGGESEIHDFKIPIVILRLSISVIYELEFSSIDYF